MSGGNAKHRVVVVLLAYLLNETTARVIQALPRDRLGPTRFQPYSGHNGTLVTSSGASINP